MLNPLVVKVLSLPNMPSQAIMTRLGYREKTADKATILSRYQGKIDQYARSLKIRVFYIKKQFTIVGQQCDIEGYRFESNLVKSRLAEVNEVFLIGASCLDEDYQQLKAFETAGELQQAVILDSALSEKVDWSLTVLEKELGFQLRQQGKVLGPRLSCGYGDFALQNQRYFYEQLEFQKYGIALNESYLMIPEKTVTALLPVKNIGGMIKSD